MIYLGINCAYGNHDVATLPSTPWTLNPVGYVTPDRKLALTANARSGPRRSQRSATIWRFALSHTTRRMPVLLFITYTAGVVVG